MTYRTHTLPNAERRSDEWWRYYIDQWHQVRSHSFAEGVDL